jgi:hypothetical protein
MRSHNDSIDTTRTPPPLSFYNTFKGHFLDYFIYVRYSFLLEIRCSLCCIKCCTSPQNLKSFLAINKSKTVCSIHAQLVSYALDCLFKDKIKYDVSACFTALHLLIINIELKLHQNFFSIFSNLPLVDFHLYFSTIGRFSQIST